MSTDKKKIVKCTLCGKEFTFDDDLTHMVDCRKFVFAKALDYLYQEGIFEVI